MLCGGQILFRGFPNQAHLSRRRFNVDGEFHRKGLRPGLRPLIKATRFRISYGSGIALFQENASAPLTKGSNSGAHILHTRVFLIVDEPSTLSSEKNMEPV